MTHAMRELLLPQTTIVTPNSVEVRILAEAEDEEDRTLEQCAARLIEKGCEFVLVTGTHENTPDVVNTLYERRHRALRNWPRLPGTYHGSGCTLASAIAAMLANGLGLPEAVREAQEYTWQTLKKAIGPAWGSSFPIVFSGRAKKRRRAASAEAPRPADFAAVTRA